MSCSPTGSWCRLSTRPSPGAGRRAVRAAGPARPPMWCCGCLALKHMRNWSYHVLEREVRANLVYRQFTRVGAQKVPDAKTLGKLALALGPQIIEQIHAGWWPSPARSASFAAAGCGWIPRWWRPISTTRPTARSRGWRAGADPHDAAHREDRRPRRDKAARSHPRRGLSSQADRPLPAAAVFLRARSG